MIHCESEAKLLSKGIKRRINPYFNHEDWCETASTGSCSQTQQLPTYFLVPSHSDLQFDDGCNQHVPTHDS